jgi:hypothetical protein
MSLARPARAALLALCAAVVFSGCSEPPPTPPTERSNIDISGRWVWLDANGQPTRTWMLVQHAAAVEGTSLDDPPAPVPYSDTLSGSVAGSEFTFSATSTQYFPERSQQTHLGGTLTITAGTMSGTITSVPPIGKVNSFHVTIVRVLQAQ